MLQKLFMDISYCILNFHVAASVYFLCHMLNKTKTKYSGLPAIFCRSGDLTQEISWLS